MSDWVRAREWEEDKTRLREGWGRGERERQEGQTFSAG